MEVNMEDRVEVFLGDTAQITCMFTVSDSPDNVIIQWYMVSSPTHKCMHMDRRAHTR